MKNIHDLAREYLSKAGLNLKDTQKASVMKFADWLLPITAELKAKDEALEYSERNLGILKSLLGILNLSDVEEIVDAVERIKATP